jgi:hypothetical protein
MTDYRKDEIETGAPEMPGRRQLFAAGLGIAAASLSSDGNIGNYSHGFKHTRLSRCSR